MKRVLIETQINNIFDAAKVELFRKSELYPEILSGHELIALKDEIIWKLKRDMFLKDTPPENKKTAKLLLMSIILDTLGLIDLYDASFEITQGEN